MSTWIDNYKSKLISSHKRSTVVCDPDNLFVYPELQSNLLADGYKVIFADSVFKVRIQFELVLKQSTDKYIVVVPFRNSILPDILNEVNYVTISLHDLFPNLDAKALSGIGFNALCTLAGIKHYEELGYDSTLKFLLENLYNLDFETLSVNKSKERVLNALITVLIEQDGVNIPIVNYLSDLARPYFPILTNSGLSKQTLLSFLQESWNNYAKDQSPVIDFAESSLNKSIGNLFINNFLAAAVVSRNTYNEAPAGLKIGLYYDLSQFTTSELKSYIEYISQLTTTIQDKPNEWFSIIQVAAKAMHKALLLNNNELNLELNTAIQKLNSRFQQFIQNAYWSLFSLSGIRHPAVVTRILEHLKAQPSAKKALIVLDGLNFWQWEIIALKLKEHGLEFKTHSTMAYLPSITAWSRQAIFKGDKPDLTKDNSKESAYFLQYWVNMGFKNYQVQYRKFGVYLPTKSADIAPDTEQLALVCNDLDDIMHGSILGNQGLMQSTSHWLEKTNLVDLIASLKMQGFKCFVTTDHGNLEATGIKNLKLSEKVGSLSRSKRHLQFANQTMLDSFISQSTNLQLGVRGLSVYLKDESAFTTQDEKIITHGGSHLWEVLIPFIEI